MSGCKFSLNNESGQAAIKQVGEFRAQEMASISLNRSVPIAKDAIPEQMVGGIISDANLDMALNKLTDFNNHFGTSAYAEIKIVEDGVYKITDVIDNYSPNHSMEIVNEINGAGRVRVLNLINSMNPVSEFDKDATISNLLDSSTTTKDLLTNTSDSFAQRYEVNQVRGVLGLADLGNPTVTVNTSTNSLAESKAAMEKILDAQINFTTDPNIKGEVVYVNGKPVVSINEALATSDTTFHEVIGHVFINSVGGLSNPKVAALADKLEKEGTQIWKDTLSQNPSLSREQLKLEAVAQSVGMAADEVFSHPLAKSSFERFREWLMTNVAKMFNMQPSEAYELAMQGLGSDLSSVKSEEGTFYQKANGVSAFISDMKDSVDPSADNFVSFNEAEHSYTKKGVLATRSATEVSSNNSTFTKHTKPNTAKEFKMGLASTAFKSALTGMANVYGFTINETLKLKESLAVVNASAAKKQIKYDNSAIWGTKVHAIYEDILNGKTDVNSYPYELQTVAIDAMKYKKLAEDPNYEVFTEARLFHDGTRIAGSVDLIVINKKAGTFDIIDMKTKGATFGSLMEKFTSSSLDAYTKQLALYANMIEDKYDIKVNKLTIKPIGLSFTDDNSELNDITVIGKDIELTSRPAYDKLNSEMGAVVGKRMTSTADLGDISAKIYDKMQELLRVSIREKSKFNTPAQKLSAREQLDELKANFESNEAASVVSFTEYLSGKIDLIDKIIANNDTGVFTVDELHGFKGHLAALSMLDTLEEYVDANEDVLSKEDSFIYLKQAISDMRIAKAKHEKTILAGSVEALATIYAGLSNVSSVSKKDDLIRQFHKENPSTIGGKYEFEGKAVDKATYRKEMEGYIYRNLKKNMDNIQKDNYLLWKSYLKDGVFDINAFELQMADAMVTSSVLIQTTNKLFAKAELATRESVMSKRVEFGDKIAKYMTDKNLSIHQINEIMMEKDKDGEVNGYITNKYSRGFYDKLAEFDSELEQMREDALEQSDEYEVVRKARLAWRNKNVTSTGVPVESWISEEYKEHPDLIDAYNKLAEQSDNHLQGHATLGRKPWGVEHTRYKTPRIRHSALEAAMKNGVVEASKQWFGKEFTHRSDDESQEGVEIAENDLKNEGEKYTAVNVGFDGSELKSIPIYYRGDVPMAELSHDISSMLIENYAMSANFEHKSAIQPTIELLLDVVKDTRPMVKEGITGKAKRVMQSAEKRSLRTNSESNEFKMLQSLVDHRLYGIATIPSVGSKVIQAVSKYTANTMLVLNVLSGVNNLNQGLVANFIESAGNPHLNKKSMAKASRAYFKDMKNITSDINEPYPTSHTNQMVQYFNVQGEFTTLGTEYFKDNVAMKYLANNHSHFISGIGEHFLQGQLTYALLDGIKVMNASGEYLDTDGNIAKDKESAASLNDVMSFKDGKPVYSIDFYATSHNPNAKYQPVEVSEYIRDTAASLHGQYDTEMKSKLQRTAMGGAMLSLRKWFYRLGNQKFAGIMTVGKEYDELDWYDKQYSEASLEFKEGRYTSTARFFTGVAKDLWKTHKLMTSPRWNALNATQQGNVIKSFYELGMIFATWMASGLLYGLYEDDKENTAAITASYLMRRLYSELSMFGNPLELTRILRSPAVAVSTIENVLKLTGGIMTLEGFDTYQKGHRKGQWKIRKQFEGLVPVLKQANSFTTQGVADKYKYMVNSF